jgi:hypothetical protein
MTTTATSADRRLLSVRLDREWEQLCLRPALVDRARAWEVTPVRFGSLPELMYLAGFRAPPTPEADETLRRLVAVAPADPLAGRVVLQRLLPGLLAIVRRERSRDWHVDAFDVLVGEAWLAIVNYRADRRPTHVAARLLNDARHRAFTAPRRKRERSMEEPVPPYRLDLPRLPEPGSSFEELTLVLRDACRSGLPDCELAAAREYLADRSASALATERSISTRTLRNRRRRSFQRIRRYAA